MEYLDDESDELFRKAGEEYPLKTSDSDWDGVLGRLQSNAGEEQQSVFEPGGNNNKKSRLLWLLLLIPLAFLSIKYLPFGKQTSATGKAPLVQGAVHSEKENPGRQGGQTEAKPDNERENTASLPGNRNNLSRESGNQPEKAATASSFESSFSETTSPEKLKNKSSTAGVNGSGSDRETVSNPAGISNPSSSQSSTEAQETAKPGNEAAAPVKDTATKPAVAQQTATTKPEKKTKQQAKERGIYLSVLAGPDLSTVKFQSVKNVGYSVGILGGYRFNKHLSVEAGVFWDRKQYYSDGQYFDKSKTNIPAWINIEDIDGNCNMFEIPVSLRYDFSFTRKGRFFATAGLSSYLMKKENYVYTADGYGPGWSHAVSYKNSGNNLFSIIQLSAGYEYKIGNHILIRAEPYISIPLSGVGIGSLPISSAGLRLGITVPLHK